MKDPDHSLVGVLNVPSRGLSPLGAIIRRLGVALLALVATTLVVYSDGDGYRDVNEDGITLLDAAYYATVSLSTTGYGDITPASDSARLINILMITPLRLLFLIVLVGTTIELLTERSRQAFKIRRWRSRVHAHTVVVGFGTKGEAAVSTMLGDGMDPGSIVVVDSDPERLRLAGSRGLVTVGGSGARSEILRLAGVERAASVVVAPSRDDTAVLVTLTARELNSSATIVASVREVENVHLLRQSGADSVVVSSETAGRLLGMATSTPSVVNVIEDLLTPDVGFSIAERDVEHSEIGGSPRHLADIVLGVTRGSELYRVDAPAVDALEPGDRLLYVRKASGPGDGLVSGADRF
jgi:voltage-gated potassium channel